MKSCDYSKIPLDFSTQSEFSMNNMNYIYSFCNELKGTYLAKKLSGAFLEIVSNMVEIKHPELDWLDSLGIDEEVLGISRDIYFDKKNLVLSDNLVDDFHVN